MTTWITICDTCKRDGWEESGMEQTDGEVLAAQIEALTPADGPVRTRRVSCLMGCTHGCNIAIQGKGKLAYTLGKFDPADPEAEAAESIVGYASLHAASDTGQVPYRQWPQGVKGHFITRHQPLPDE